METLTREVESSNLLFITKIFCGFFKVSSEQYQNRKVYLGMCRIYLLTDIFVGGYLISPIPV